MSLRESGEIGGDKRALARRHVALRTVGFSKEQFFALQGIALDSFRRAAREQAKVTDDGLDLAVAEKPKRRHAFCRYAVSYHLRERAVSQRLNVRVSDNSGPMLTASCIQPVACAAGRFKSLFPGVDSGLASSGALPGWVAPFLRRRQLQGGPRDGGRSGNDAQ